MTNVCSTRTMVKRDGNFDDNNHSNNRTHARTHAHMASCIPQHTRTQTQMRRTLHGRLRNRSALGMRRLRALRVWTSRAKPSNHASSSTPRSHSSRAAHSGASRAYMASRLCFLRSCAPCAKLHLSAAESRRRARGKGGRGPARRGGRTSEGAAGVVLAQLRLRSSRSRRSHAFSE